MKNEKNLFELFDKFCEPNVELSTEELRQIISLLGSEQEDDSVTRWMQQHWEESRTQENSFKTSKPLSLMQFLYRSAAVFIVPLLGLCAYLLIQINTPSEPIQTEIIAVYSQEMPSMVTLSDGSTVMLKSGSRLIKKNNFSGRTREVILEGEAFFDISHNPNRPFIIHTGPVRTTVLGTSFSITAIPGEGSMTVTVVEGTVRIEDGEELLTILEANQQFTYGFELDVFQQSGIEADLIAAEVSLIEIEDFQPKFLIFRNMPFGDIVQDLATKHGVDIVFLDEELKHQRIDALLNSREPIDVLLRLLCATHQATYTIESGVFVIRSMR